jgi:hypothetical protein
MSLRPRPMEVLPPSLPRRMVLSVKLPSPAMMRWRTAGVSRRRVSMALPLRLCCLRASRWVPRSLGVVPLGGLAGVGAWWKAMGTMRASPSSSGHAAESWR